MAKKFTNTDLFESDLFDLQISKAEELLLVIERIEKAGSESLKKQQKLLREFGKIDSLEKLRALEESIRKVTEKVDEMLKLRSEEMKLEEKLRVSKTEQAKVNAKLKDAINEQNKATRESIKDEKALIEIQKKEIKSLQDLQDKNNALIRVRKNLDQTTKEGIADYRRLTAEINQNNAVLKKHDAAIGNYQRNVGNYRDALRGYGSALLGVLGAGSFIAIAQSAAKSTAEFTQSMADLKAITGATDEQMKFFEETALGQTMTMEGSTASAKQYTEALKLIASAKPELLENAAALDEMTQKALLLSDASGLELPDAATRLTDAMNQFGASSDQAGKFVDVLAAAAKYGSAEIPQITEALLEFGPVAKSYNVSIQESAAAIEGLAEKGIKGSEAGTKFRNVLLALGAAKGLPKEAQESFERVGIDVNILADNSLTLEERLTELSKAQNDEVAMLKIFGKENISAAKTVLSQKDRIAELTEKVDENGIAQEQAAVRTSTLAGEWKKLGNAWEAQMIQMSQSSGDLAGFVRFLRENLATIVDVLARVVRGFVIYKTTLGAINLVTATARTLNAAYNSSLNLMGKGVKGADGAMKGLNSTMKANIIAIVAIAVVELADALDLFTRKAEVLQKQLDSRLDSLKQWGEQNKKQANEELQKAIEVSDEKIRLAQSEGKTEEEISQIRKQGYEEQAAIAQKFRDKEMGAFESYAEKVVTIEGQLSYMQQQKAEAMAEEDEMRARVAKGIEKYSAQEWQAVGKLARGQDQKMENLEQELKEAKGSYQIQEELINGYDEVIRKSNVENQIITNETNVANVQSTKVATESQIAEWKRKAEEIKRIELELRRWLQDLQAGNIEGEREREIAQENLAFQREEEKLKEKLKILGKTTEEGNEISQQLQIAHNKKLEDIKKKHDKKELEESLEDLEYQYKVFEEHATRTITDEEKLSRKLLDLKTKQVTSEIEILKGNLADKEKIVDKEIELNNLLLKQEENILSTTQQRADAWGIVLQKMYEDSQAAAEAQKKMIKDVSDAAQILSDSLTKMYTEASQKREAAIDKDIENSKTRQDELRSLAERQVLEADQSLAAEERKEAELQRKKLEEQKKQQRAELLNTAFKSYAGHVENKDASPITSTIRDITTLLAFINSLPAFLEGTESTGKGGSMDKDGGFMAMLHPNERVMTAEQNEKLAGASNEEVVRVYEEAKAIRGTNAEAVRNMKMADIFAQSTQWNEGPQIVQKLDELKSEIKNKQVQRIYVDQVSQKIVDEITEGNKVTRNHFGKFNLNA